MCQKLLFRNGYVAITPDGIDFLPQDLSRCRNAVPRDFKRIQVIKTICKTNDLFEVVANTNVRCEFLQFIGNTCEDIRDLDIENFLFHSIVNKITALGYLLTDWKPRSESKAVMIRDRHLDGFCSGKTLLASAIGHIRNVCCLDGLSICHRGLQDADPEAHVILLDDVRAHFDFRELFLAITDDLRIRRKNRPEIVVKWEDSPKLLLTSNFDLKNANDTSAKRRLAYVDMSGHYNLGHTPIDDFGHYLFHNWNLNQWQLFDNFMMECIMYYFRSYNNNWGGQGQGIVQPPKKLPQI